MNPNRLFGLRPILVYGALVTTLALLAAPEAEATHIRAGDITGKVDSTRNPVDLLRYVFTVNLYLDTDGINPVEGRIVVRTPNGDRIIAADESVNFVDAVPQPSAPNTRHIIYTFEYRFPSAGTFIVSFDQDNRNPGVLNMDGSVNTNFHVESTFSIDPTLGGNSSPILLISPIDQACTGVRFVHNPGAFDSDGDSLAYRLTFSRQSIMDIRRDNGQVVGETATVESVDNFSFPHLTFGGTTEENDCGTVSDEGPATLTMDPITGELSWDAPLTPGEYNVAFFVEEWRGGFLIGQVNRDMQIIVRDCANQRPDIEATDEICTVARLDVDDRMTVVDTVTTTDLDDCQETLPQDFVTLEMQSGISENADEGELFPDFARFSLVEGDQPPDGEQRGVLEWAPGCSMVREQPYDIFYRSEDDPPGDPTVDNELVDIQSTRITVVGPPPTGLVTTAVDAPAAEISLSWDPYECPNGERIFLWRRINSIDIEPDTCNPGGPPGYTLIDNFPAFAADGTPATEYTDTDVPRGGDVCYRIHVGFPFPQGGSSLFSNEACAFMPSAAPYMLKVDIAVTDAAEGVIDVEWSTPITIDSVAFPPPYTFTLKRAIGSAGNAELTGLLVETTDTTFTDTGLNTLSNAYNYRVDLFSQGNFVETSRSASSVRLALQPSLDQVTLDWGLSLDNVPWNNSVSSIPFHYIYRGVGEDTPPVLIDSVDVTQTDGFRYVDDDEALEQEVTYCYFVMTQGAYEVDTLGFPVPLLNRSQIACTTLLDTIPPCPPVVALPQAVNGLEIFECPESEAELRDPVQNSEPCPPTEYVVELNWEDVTTHEGDECQDDIVGYNVYFQLDTDNPDDRSAFQLVGQTDVPNFAHVRTAPLSPFSIKGCYYVAAVDFSGNEGAPSAVQCNENCPYYELPNVFSPNGDGVNDTFRAFRCPLFVEQVEFHVYNRYGKLVYESDDEVNIEWDGTSRDGGQVVSSGTYYYKAVVKYWDEDDKQTLNGWIVVQGD